MSGRCNPRIRQGLAKSANERSEGGNGLDRPETFGLSLFSLQPTEWRRGASPQRNWYQEQDLYGNEDQSKPNSNDQMRLAIFKIAGPMYHQRRCPPVMIKKNVRNFGIDPPSDLLKSIRQSITRIADDACPHQVAGSK